MAMTDNRADVDESKRKKRWMQALLGGIVLPFDPLLGMVLLIVGLWRPKKPHLPAPR